MYNHGRKEQHYATLSVENQLPILFVSYLYLENDFNPSV
jgi:hypothetical protein